MGGAACGGCIFFYFVKYKPSQVHPKNYIRAYVVVDVISIIIIINANAKDTTNNEVIFLLKFDCGISIPIDSNRGYAS